MSKDKMSKVEFKTDVFTFKSNLVSVLKEGAWFTSNIKGFSFSSNKMSKPINSKHIIPDKSST